MIRVIKTMSNFVPIVTFNKDKGYDIRSCKNPSCRYLRVVKVSRTSTRKRLFCCKSCYWDYMGFGKGGSYERV